VIYIQHYFRAIMLLQKHECSFVYRENYVNPLNTELNPICHLLVLLGDLTFMRSCIVSIFQYTCISNKMQHYTVYLYLETALQVSGSTSTHHQERIQLYLQHLVFVTPLLLSAAIAEELEPTGLSVLWVAYAKTGSNSSTIAADSSNGVTNTRCCRYSCMRS
jgi:GTP:adenosylcobinamide-phosphate guanylyltransferase